MRYYVLPREGFTEDMRVALVRGLGLSPKDSFVCERHCQRYGVGTSLETFIEELEEAQTALATAKVLGAMVMVDWQGQLCYDLPLAPDDGSGAEDAEVWKDDRWLASLIDGETSPHRS